MASPNGRPDSPRRLDRLAALLTRETSFGGVILEIDGFRFIAITAVVVFHLMHLYLVSTTTAVRITPQGDDWSAVNRASPLLELISVGFWGVQLFFVVSGFVLALPFIEMFQYGGRQIRLSLYYVRRLIRIEPPYLVNLILLFLVIWATKPYILGYVPHLVATMAYSHFLIYGDWSLISGITWSLEVEAQFYLAMPLLAGVFRIRSTTIRRLVLVAAMVLFGLLQLWFASHAPPWILRRLDRNLLYWLQYFLAGFLLADIYAAHHNDWKKKEFLWDGVGVATAIVTFEIMLRHFRLHPLVPFLILLFYLSVFRGPILNWLLTLRWVVVIGGMCYTIYLYHEAVINHFGPPVIARIGKLPFWPGFAITAVLALAAVLAVSGLMFALIEKPFMRLSSRLARSPENFRRVSDWIYSKLARVTSTGEYIAEADGFRFVSILAVMLAHASYQFVSNRAGYELGDDFWKSTPGRAAHVLAQGHAGVLMFFAISGFVIALPFARAWLGGKNRPSLRLYFLRRVTRIEPPYILNITFCFLVFGGLAHLSSRIWPYLASIAYLPNIVYAKFSTINVVVWPLEVEIQFYLLAPLLACIFGVRSAFWRRLILVAGMAAFGALANFQMFPLGPAHLRHTLMTYLGYFLAGFLLADLYETGVVWRRRSLAWDALALGAAMALVYGIGWHWWKAYWALSFLILLMWVGGFQGRIANWFFTRRFIATFGGMCYTMYLWHNPLLQGGSRLFELMVPQNLPAAAQVLLADTISISTVAAVCAVLFYYTERPFMGNRIPAWIAAKWHGVPVPAGAAEAALVQRKI
jgi:peptidoglycan/LPS O-acetylase OafA/YrhL